MENTPTILSTYFQLNSAVSSAQRGIEKGELARRIGELILPCKLSTNPIREFVSDNGTGRKLSEVGKATNRFSE